MNTIATKEKILFKDGKPNAVILDISRYEKLLEAAEEKEDLAELKRIKKTKTKWFKIKHRSKAY